MRSSQSEDVLSDLQKDHVHFAKLAHFLKTKVGINLILNDKNLTLMASRLVKIFKKRGINNYKEYIAILKKNLPEDALEFISAMTTNTTQFFREADHFDILRNRLKDLIEQKKQEHNYEIRIWCSASSTGQEVYTILMVLMDVITNLNVWDIKFLATDIDLNVLNKAAAGIYRVGEMGGLSELQKSKYFDFVGGKDDDQYQVKPQFRELIRFAPFNLLTEKFPFQFSFDVVFCRNVLIYFDRPTAEVVIEKLVKALGVKGLLFLGHSETGMIKTKLAKTIANGVYTKVE
jgi:chemotaxis protein methyltransferase CheR